MRQRHPKRGVIGVMIALVAMAVSLSAQAASKATATCQCQEGTAMATRADTAAHQVSLGARLVQDLRQMHCAEVKSIFERLPHHYLGPGKFTSELIEYAAK